jgi:hypothetical protein
MDYEEFITSDGRKYFIKTDQFVEGFTSVQYFEVKRDNTTLPEKERAHISGNETIYTPAIKLSRTQGTIWKLNRSQTLEALEKIGIAQIKLELERGTDITNYSKLFSTDAIPANMKPEELEAYLISELESLRNQIQNS